MSDGINSNEPVKLGKYIIQTELGQGAMGVVYKGIDPFIERSVAIKTIRKNLLDIKESEIILARFKREAQAAGKLNHPNIVSVYEYGEDGDTAFIVMEFVQGLSLKEFFDNNERFDLSDIITIMSQILGALSYSHKHGVVHRDIKPANIILAGNNQIKITDFGVAHVESSNLTRTGMIVGTPNYMSPEQFMGNPVDGRSDIFCAGVILYQFITGENPFNGRTIATIMQKVLNEEPLEPASLNLNINSEFNNVIKKAIAKRPENRFQTAGEFFEAIQHAALQEPPVYANYESEASVIIPSRKKMPETPDDLQKASNDEAEQQDSRHLLKRLVSGFMIILICAGIFWFLKDNVKEDSNASSLVEEYSQIPAKTDKLSPSGEVAGIEPLYIQGDSITYKINAADDKELRNISFEIKNSPAGKESWNVGGKSVSRESSFITSNWNPGTYAYVLSIEDRAGNYNKVKGNFNLKAKQEIPSEPAFDYILKQVMGLGIEKKADFLQLWTNQRSFKIGDIISYHFQSSKACHLILICITSDGSLQQIFPNQFSPDSLIKANQEYMIPGKDIELEVVGPKGSEIIIAVVSEIPFNPLSASFEDQPFFEVYDNQALLNKISENIKKAKSLNLSQKRIRYSIR